jgi:hypothetical protein
LEPDSRPFHIEVAAVLPSTEGVAGYGGLAHLEYMLLSFTFESPSSPDFTFTPHLKRAPDDVIPDRVFYSPATIIQAGSHLVSLIPDRDLITSNIVYADLARPYDPFYWGYTTPRTPTGLASRLS